VTDSTPVISIVAPTRDRSVLLGACLEALARQTFDPARFEVIVVDDGSVDGTPDLLGAAMTPYRLRTVRTTGLGAGAARNRGAALADAGLLLFLDDDVEPAPDLVSEHVAAHDDRSVVGLGRLDTRVPPDAGGYARHLARWWARHDARLRSDPDRPEWPDCYSGNLSVERKAFEAVGGFAEDLARSDDVELGYRLRGAGQRFVYLEKAVATQTLDKPFRRLLDDAQRTGEVAPALYRRHPPMLPRLEIGRFGQARTRTRLARGLLVRTGLPEGLLATLDRVRLPDGPSDRWYAFVTNLAYWRGVRRRLAKPGDRETWRRLTVPPVVLMYHAFARDGETGSRWVVPTRSLAAQLRLLRWLGRTVVPLGELVDARREHRLPPAGAVAITIDDGYLDVLAALPIFERARAQVTLFLVSDRLGRQNDWDRSGPLAGRPILAEEELAALDARLVSFGAHTRTHADLIESDLAEAQRQVEGSAADLAAHDLLSDPAIFAYPYGRSDARAMEIARARFDAAVVTHPGFLDPAVPDHALGRIEVSGSEGLHAFALDVLLGGSRPQLTILRRARQRPEPASIGVPRPPSTIAVVIPTIGRPAALERCLVALRDGRRRPEEVVVIDQTDRPDIDRVVRDLDTGWTQLRRIPCHPRGVAVARNEGWRATTGSIVAFTDDDCVPDPDWLVAVAAAFEGDTALDAVTGRVLALGPEQPGLHAVSTRADVRPRMFSGRSLPWLVGTGGNLAVRRDALLRIDGFDLRLGPGTSGEAAEDVDLLYRLLAAGSHIRYEPGSLVLHERQPTDRRRRTRTRYGHGLGAFVALTLRRGDPYGAVILGAWVAQRLRLLLGATLRPDSPGAMERALDERLMLRGLAQGLAQGLSHAGGTPGPDVES
jgi:GT2 family glycosyltransferase/peptidoglycan/xylan/chitin deacetylase (PgdA/CDA1 family)